MPFKIEHGLVVAGASAIVYARVLGIIRPGVAGCPACAILFPQRGVFFIGSSAYGNPRAFPVAHAQPADGVHRGDDVGHLVGLALHRDGVRLFIRAALADGVAAEIAVRQGVGIAGFGDHHLLAIGVGHLGEHLRQVVQRAVPVGIVAGGEHVVVQIVIGQLGGVGHVAARAFRVCEMHGHQRPGEHLPHGAAALPHQLVDVHPGLFAAEPAVGFVAQLHHAHVHARVLQLMQAVRGIGVQRLGLLGNLHARPGLGGLLLAGVGPEVGVVEIHQQAHAVDRGAAADFHCGGDVAVASAIAVALAVKGVVPHPDADIVDAAIRQDGEQIPFLPVKIVVFHPRRFQRKHRGHVHAQDEVLRQVFHMADVQRTLLPQGGEGRKAQGQQ